MKTRPWRCCKSTELVNEGKAFTLPPKHEKAQAQLPSMPFPDSFRVAKYPGVSERWLALKRHATTAMWMFKRVLARRACLPKLVLRCAENVMLTSQPCAPGGQLLEGRE